MIEWIVSSSILILTVIVLRFCLRGRISQHLQYALWALVLVRLAVPFQIGSAAFSVENRLAQTPVVQQMDLAGQVAHISYNADGTATGYYTYAPGENRVEPMPQAFTWQQAEQISRVRSITDITMIVWVLGMVAVGGVFLMSNLRFAGRLKKSRVLLEKQHLPVYVTDVVETPCLFGLFRPAIYLPSAVAGEARHRYHAIAHETTHYRHGDGICSALRCLCLVLHWYNPLVWWAAVLSRADGELACDAATIRYIGEENRGEYGRVLVDLTCRKPGNLLQTATMMTGSAKGIRERISLIAKKPKMAVYTLIVVILVAAVAVGCTFTGGESGKEPDVPPDVTQQAGVDDTEETNPDTTQQTEEDVTEDTVPDTTSPEPTDPPVIEGPLGEFVQIDVAETVTGTDGRNQWSVSIRVPKLLPFSKDAEACQKEIQDIYYPLAEEISTDSAKGFWPVLLSVEFEAYLNDGILSLVICEQTNYDTSHYRVYNFDTATGVRLDSAALAEKLAITDYAQKVKQVAQAAFEQRYGFWQDDPLYAQQHAATVSEENVAKGLLYLAEEGKPIVVMDIYSCAGAPYYSHAIPLP